MNALPNISFVIPAYNMGCFLKDAIHSCQHVASVEKEIIVIDDGSTDDTPGINRSYPHINYHFQQNQGLSAARNKGLALAKGEFICFLDADDWLIPENILESLRIMEQDSTLAFVFGRHYIQHENGSVQLHQPKIDQEVYHHLLRSNIIGNPSTVLYRSQIARQYPFSSNPAFKGCEDYHQYLQIARKHKIAYHDLPVSVYRRHPSNMSNNLAMMLDAALNVLYDHRQYLTDVDSLEQWNKGLNAWLAYYSYFPLRSGGKLHFNQYHFSLARKLGWKLPYILLQKWLS